MTFQTGIALALAMFALAVTPGPGVLVTTSRALASGVRPALVVILGIVSGDLVYLLLATFGLSMIADALGELFVVVKIVGGLYLIGLGLRMWLRRPTGALVGGLAGGAQAAARPAAESAPVAETSPLGNYATGLATTLSNPKVILFYGGFLPTFIDLSSLHAADLAIILGIVAAVLFSVMGCYALLAARARAFVARTSATKWLERVAGSAMIATGAVVLLRR